MPNYFDQFDAPAAPAAKPAAGGNWSDPNHLLKLADALQRAGRGTEAAQVFKRVMELQGGGEPTRYSTTPQYGYNAAGEAVPLLFGNDGTVKTGALPQGVTLSQKPIEIDAGTHTVLMDPITRQEIGRVPKNVAETASASAQGEAEGKNIGETLAGAPDDIANAERMLEQVRALQKDPYRERGTGGTSFFNFIPGSAGKDYQAKVDMLKGGAFMEGVNRLGSASGMTEVEGKKATDSITNLDTAQSEEGFSGQLKGLEDFLVTQIDRAKGKLAKAQGQPAPQRSGMLGGTPSAASAPADVPAAPAPAATVPAVTNDVAQPRNKAEYDALPKGAFYIKQGWTKPRQKQ